MSADDLIRDVASRHGVALGRDDPILMLHTAIERMVAESVKAQEQAMQKHAEALDALAARWDASATARADRTAKAAIDAVRAALQGVVAEAAGEAGKGVRREMEFALSQYRAAVAQARRLAWMNLLAAAMTMAAVVLLLLRVWG